MDEYVIFGGGTSNEQHAHAMSHPQIVQSVDVVPLEELMQARPQYISVDFGHDDRTDATLYALRGSTSGGRKHVSDAAWEAYDAHWVAANRDGLEQQVGGPGCVLLTVSEHEADRQEIADLLNAHETMDKEINALRAEVERLRADKKELADLWKLARKTMEEMRQSHAKRTAQLHVKNAELKLDNERLRKGREDETRSDDEGKGAGVLGTVGQGVEQTQQVSTRAQALNAANAFDGAANLRALDPRLGLPQPEGEPVEPMSAKGWRWLG